MGKMGSKAVGDVKTKIVFATVTKEVGEGDAKQTFTLKYEDVTERFSLKKDSQLLVSSCCLSDCIHAAAEHKVAFTSDETKVTYKPIG
jgi:hypothetical protein